MLPPFVKGVPREAFTKTGLRHLVGEGISAHLCSAIKKEGMKEDGNFRLDTTKASESCKRVGSDIP